MEINIQNKTTEKHRSVNIVWKMYKKSKAKRHNDFRIENK